MEQRLSMVTLGVADLASAKKYYEEVVGWKATPSPPGIVFFDLGGLVFSLFPHGELANEIQGQEDNREGSEYKGFTLAHNARSKGEVDQIFVRLMDNGGTITKMPEETLWGGYSGYFADLDGNSWEIAYKPYWVIKEDGRVSMG